MAALRESEQRFGKFMQRLPGLAWIKDLDGRYVFVNDAAEQAFRRPRAELLGRTDEQIFPPEVAAQFRANDAEALASGTGIETIETLEHADGVHHSMVSKFPIPGPDGEPSLIGGVAIDITARIQAEEVIRESEERFRDDGRQRAGDHLHDPARRLLHFPLRRLDPLTGKTIEAGLGFGWGDVGAPRRPRAACAVFAQTAPATFRSSSGSRRGRRPSLGDRHRRAALREGRRVPRLRRARCSTSTSEKRTEDALRNSVQLYRAIGESIDYGVWVCDPNGRNMYASESFLQPGGPHPGGVLGLRLDRALHPDDAERTRRSGRSACARAGRGTSSTASGASTASGIRCSRAACPVQNERGETTAWAGINLDISRLKQAEDELREADRRKDEFLAMLAHELRNPLAPIRNAAADPAQLARRRRRAREQAARDDRAPGAATWSGWSTTCSTSRASRRGKIELRTRARRRWPTVVAPRRRDEPRR